MCWQHRFIPQLFLQYEMKKLLNLIGGSQMEAEKEEKFILMTYRSGINKVIPSTYYESDSGWGCMLRVGQMAIANLLHFHDKVAMKVILELFWDNSDEPFSIQQFTAATLKIYPHKKPFEWYNPCEMSFLIKDLLERECHNMHVKVFPDNSLFLSQIPKTHSKLLVIILIRIGLEEPEEIYLPVIDSLMNNRFFFAALGGTPKHAHLFLKSKKGQIGYLDPHKVLKAASSEEDLLAREAEYWSSLSWLKATKIDSSMAMIFRLEKEEVEEYWKSLQEIKARHKSNFFIYMDKERPELGEGDIIEIADFQ